MMIKRPKLFENGRINYKIEYTQFQVEMVEGVKTLMEEQVVHYYQFPFTFDTHYSLDECADVGAYYRQ